MYQIGVTGPRARLGEMQAALEMMKTEMILIGDRRQLQYVGEGHVNVQFLGETLQPTRTTGPKAHHLLGLMPSAQDTGDRTAEFNFTVHTRESRQDTRTSNQLSLPRVRNNHGKRAFIYRSVTMYNKLVIAKGADGLPMSKFKKYIKLTGLQ